MILFSGQDHDALDTHTIPLHIGACLFLIARSLVIEFFCHRPEKSSHRLSCRFDLTQSLQADFRLQHRSVFSRSLPSEHRACFPMMMLCGGIKAADDGRIINDFSAWRNALPVGDAGGISPYSAADDHCVPADHGVRELRAVRQSFGMMSRRCRARTSGMSLQYGSMTRLPVFSPRYRFRDNDIDRDAASSPSCRFHQPYIDFRRCLTTTLPSCPRSCRCREHDSPSPTRAIAAWMRLQVRNRNFLPGLIFPTPDGRSGSAIAVFSFIFFMF